MTSDSEGFQRRRPKQSRSRATCEAILEAASQILERTGPQGFTTASVAERAGVSIGTLYQYFPDKQAILLAAAQRALGLEDSPPRQRALMRALIDWAQSLGGSAGTVRAMPNLTAVKRPDRRRPAFERRMLNWIADLDLIVRAFTPAPIPIPIPIRGRRRG